MSTVERPKTLRDYACQGRRTCRTRIYLSIGEYRAVADLGYLMCLDCLPQRSRIIQFVADGRAAVVELKS